MYTYTIRMYTSSLSWAGTNANVNLTLYGTEAESQEQIFKNDLKTTFKSGTKDTFTVDTEVSLGTLTKVRVGHDNTGHLPGWKLVKIEIEDDMTGKGIEFDCYQWFDLESGDGKIQRELHPSGDFKAKTYLYKIFFHTGEVSLAGTDANVFITLFGTKGDSGEIKIDNQGNTTFENGMIDTYDIEKRLPLGTLTKVRVGHDNTGFGPGWFLDKITVVDVLNDQKVVFPCGRWLSVDEDDGMIERQLIGDDFEIRDKEAKIREMKEQEEEDRKRREEEERRMREEEERKRREQEQIEKFENDKKKKEEERKRRIEENRKKREEREKRRSREILGEIDVQTERERKRSESEEKKRREEEIERKEKEILKKEEERKVKRQKEEDVWKRKGKDEEKEEERNERNQEDILLREEEKHREKLKLLIKNEERRRNEEKCRREEENRRRKEENRRKDEERRREGEEKRRKKEENRREEEENQRKREESRRKEKAKHRNEEEEEEEEQRRKEEEKRRREEDKVRDEEDNRRKDEDKLREEEKELRDKEEQRRREEDKRRKQEDDQRKKEDRNLELQPNEFLYRIYFYTGEKWFAGTDSNIYATLFGTRGDSGQFKFVNQGTTTFEAGMLDTYDIKTKFPLGTLKKIHVSHDNKGWLPGWYLNKITVRDTVNGHTVVFPCGRWLKGGEIFADKNDFKIRDREGKAKEDEEQRRKQEEQQRQDEEKKRQQAERNRQEEEKKRQEAEKRRQEEERKRQAAEQKRKDEEKKRQDAEMKRQQEREMRTYKVYLFTEDAFGAWTGTDIYLTLYGSEEESAEHVVNSEGPFGDGMKAGTLEVECPRHLGTLTHIRIGPDHTGWASPWFLVAVEDPKTDDVVVFTCNRSIDTEKLNSPHIYYPSHTNDVDDLLALEADTSEDWKLVKKTKKAMIFRKKSPENDLVPPIIKADLHLQGIPYKTAVQYFTDWEVRQRWDKTFGVVDILEKIGKFKVVYCSNKMPTFCKNRDMVLACLDHPGQQYHIQIMCSILHPVVPQNLKTNKIRANTSSFGIIIRPVDDGTQSSKITVITQVDLKGSAPKFIKNGYLENNPIKWIKMMKKYYKKHGHEEEAGAKDQGTTESINNNVDDVIA